MLTASEKKVVIATLTKRRSYLMSTLQNNDLDEATRNEHLGILNDMDSALQKLAKMNVVQSQPKQADPSPAASEPKKTRELTLKSAQILIAEDKQDSAYLLLEVLKDIGFVNIDIAENGVDAFDKIKKNPGGYDLILCDWDMPGLTGLEVYSKAKASNTLKQAYFIMVTAVTEAGRIRQAVQQGINDYIVKPVDPDKLSDKVRKALNITAAST